MRTSDFNIRPSSNSLNETLNSKFGEKLDINNYSFAQLSRAAALIESKLAAYNKSKFNDTLQNEEFHRLKLMHDVVKTALNERAVSKSQQQAAGAALAAKRGKGKATGASKEMMKMSTKELEKIAGTKHKGLPDKVDEASKSKPDFLDFDKDGNKKEPMKKAVKDKKVGEAMGTIANQKAAAKFKDSDVSRMMRDEKARKAAEEEKKKKKKVDEGILGGIAGGGLGYLATGGNPLGALAGGYLGSQLDEVAELAWESARNYVKSHRRGMLEQSKHYRESCKNWGGKIWHDDMGECWMSHASINEGQPFKIHGLGEDFTTIATDAMGALSKAGTDLANFATQSPGAAALGAGAAGAAGLAAGSMLGGDDTDESLDEFDLAGTISGWGADAGRYVGDTFAKMAPDTARSLAGDPSVFGLTPSDATIASGVADKFADIGSKAALPVAAGLGGIAAGSMLGGRKKQSDTDEGLIKGAKRIAGGAVGGAGGVLAGGLAGAALGNPQLGALAGGGLGALAGAGSTDEGVASSAKKALNFGKKALGGTVGALGGGALGKMAGTALGSPELGIAAGAGLGALAGVDAMDEEHLAKKDYDGDGKIEPSSAEWKGSRDKAIKRAMYMKETIQVKESILKMLREGEEGKAEIIMAVKNMVDKFTGWSEDIAQMQAQTAMEMADSIRDEMGNDVAEQFTAAVQPALDAAFQGVKSARETLSTTVGTLTGESPAPMGAGAMPSASGEMTPDAMPPMPPSDETSDEMPDLETPPEGRTKRESIERRFRITKILAG